MLGRYGDEKGNAGTGAEKGGVGPEVTGGASRGTTFGPGGLVWKGDYNHRVTKKIKHEAKIETYDTGGVRALRFRTVEEVSHLYKDLMNCCESLARRYSRMSRYVGPTKLIWADLRPFVSDGPCQKKNRACLLYRRGQGVFLVH